MAGPSITEHEINKVSQMMRDGWDSYQYVEEFEERFAKYNSRKYCLMTPCCTHAIHLALLSLNVNINDEIIVPECTWTGSVAPVTYLKATPVFSDISKENWCIDPDSIIQNITPKTKGVISVNLYGRMPNYEKINEICKKNNLFLIEDAAESLGSTLKGRISGSFGTFSVHSFHRTKTITTGEGGALLTDDLELYQRCKFLRDHGRSTKIPYFTLEATPKYMPSNLMGSLACAQLDRIDELISIKRNIRDSYIYELQEVIQDIDIIKDGLNYTNGCWATTLVVNSDSFRSDEAIEFFKSKNLPLRPFFYPLTSMPGYKKYKKRGDKYKNPCSNYLSSKGLTLPSHYNMNQENIKIISSALKEFIKNKN